MNSAEIERFLGNCLAASIDDDLGAVAALMVLRRGDVPWEQVAEAANIALVTPALRGFLCRAELSHLVPPVVRHHIDGAYFVSRQRNMELWSQTLEVVGLLNNIGVNPVLLKGAANLAAGLYPGRGSRMMFDIDLLVPVRLEQACISTLKEAGYVEMQLSPDHRQPEHHYPAIHIPGKPAIFELHREPVAARDGGQTLLSSAEMFERATLCTEGSVTFAIPPAELRIINAVVHDMMADRGFPRGKRSLRSLYDVLLIGTRHADEVSWKRISDRFAVHGREPVISAYNLALENIAGCPSLVEKPGVRARLAHWKWLLQRRIPPLNRAVLRLHRIGVKGLINPRRWIIFLWRRMSFVKNSK